MLNKANKRINGLKGSLLRNSANQNYLTIAFNSKRPSKEQASSGPHQQKRMTQQHKSGDSEQNRLRPFAQMTSPVNVGVRMQQMEKNESSIDPSK